MSRSSFGNVTVPARQLVDFKGTPMLLVASEASWLAQTNHGIYGIRLRENVACDKQKASILNARWPSVSVLLSPQLFRRQPCPLGQHFAQMIVGWTRFVNGAWAKPSQSVVQRLDPQRRPFLVVLQRLIGEGDIVHVGQENVVDLQEQAGGNDRRIFLVQRIREREEKFRLIVLVLEPWNGAGRRDYGQKSGMNFCLAQRRLEIVDVAPDRCLPRVRQRRYRSGHRASADAVSESIEHRIPEICPGSSRRPSLDRYRVPRSHRDGSRYRRTRLRNLPELAVADDIDAGACLTLDHLCDGFHKTGVERATIDGNAVVESRDVVEQLLRPRQNADMRC